MYLKNKSDIVKYFNSGCKMKNKLQIGVEHEKFLFNNNSRKRINVRQAVVFCGGFGKRLGLKTKRIPKPLIKVNKIPFIEHIIFQYSRIGVKKILLL